MGLQSKNLGTETKPRFRKPGLKSSGVLSARVKYLGERVMPDPTEYNVSKFHANTSEGGLAIAGIDKFPAVMQFT